MCSLISVPYRTMNTGRTLIRIIKNKKILQRKEKVCGSKLVKHGYFPCLDSTHSSCSANHSKPTYQPVLRSHSSPSGTLLIHPRPRTRWNQLVKHVSSDVPNGEDGSGSKDDKDTGNGTTKSGGPHNGGPLCPHCKEPFTDTFSSLSKSNQITIPSLSVEPHTLSLT